MILFSFRVDNIPLLAKKSKEVFSSISPRTPLGEKIALLDLDKTSQKISNFDEQRYI